MTSFSAEAFFRYQIYLGLFLSSSRRAAIRSNDLSGRCIHPLLVHVCHLWGTVFWQETSKVQCHDDEMAYFRLASNIIIASRRLGGSQNADPVAFLQAQNLLGMYCFFRMKLSAGVGFHQGSAQTVAEHGLHIMDTVEYQSNFTMSEESQALCRLLLIDRLPHNPVKMDSMLVSMLIDELDMCLVSLTDISSLSLILPISVDDAPRSVHEQHLRRPGVYYSFILKRSRIDRCKRSCQRYD